MVKMERYLITTADLRTWKFDRPVLFLGEWCRLYDVKDIWSKMDAIVAEPYGLGWDKKLQDNAYYKSLLPQVLRNLADALNGYHGTNHGLRYWHILLGPWLQYFVQTTFNRYNTLKQALENHEISGVTTLSPDAYCLAVPDTRSFQMACSDHVWNNVLYNKIMEFWHVGFDVNKEFIQDEKWFVYQKPSMVKEKGMMSILKTGIRQLVENSVPMFCRNDDAFIISSYLPQKKEVELQIRLGQVPQFWKELALDYALPDMAIRRELLIDDISQNEFERFLCSILAEAIPSCFVEGYGALTKRVESLPWPLRPRFILTACNYTNDEIFKVYTASNVEIGVPYFAATHGNYGTNPYFQIDEDSTEVQTSDKFLIWGKNNRSEKYQTAFNFKLAGMHPRQEVNESGDLLLIEWVNVIRFYPYDAYYEYGIYQEQQFRFVEALPEAIQKELMVRLHGGFRETGWCDDLRWQDRCPDVRIDAGRENIRNLTDRSRLVVHSYDSTGLPETLALNIPTMCFWLEGLDHLFPDARQHYQSLRDAGILANSPEHAAELIALRWNNIGEWWMSNEVQDARQEFCFHFGRMEEYPIQAMKRLLTEHEKRG